MRKRICAGMTAFLLAISLASCKAGTENKSAEDTIRDNVVEFFKAVEDTDLDKINAFLGEDMFSLNPKKDPEAAMEATRLLLSNVSYSDLKVEVGEKEASVKGKFTTFDMNKLMSDGDAAIGTDGLTEEDADEFIINLLKTNSYKTEVFEATIVFDLVNGKWEAQKPTYNGILFNPGLYVNNE